MIQSKIEVAYARSDLFERRRRLMNDRAAHLGGLLRHRRQHPRPHTSRAASPPRARFPAPSACGARSADPVPRPASGTARTGMPANTVIPLLGGISSLSIAQGDCLGNASTQQRARCFPPGQRPDPLDPQKPDISLISQKARMVEVAAHRWAAAQAGTTARRTVNRWLVKAMLAEQTDEWGSCGTSA